MIPSTGRPTRITPTTLREWRAHSDAVRVLDVRTPADSRPGPAARGA